MNKQIIELYQTPTTRELVIDLRALSFRNKMAVLSQMLRRWRIVIPEDTRL